MNTDHKKSFVLIGQARSQKQREIMERIEKDGVCPFCAENFLTYHTKPVIKETNSWILTENFEPYEGTRFHFLFVYKPSHINSPSEMTDESQLDLFKLINELTAKHNLAGGSILMRFGDGNVNGSSVEHLHAHLIVGEEKGENTEGLKVKVGYKKIS